VAGEDTDVRCDDDLDDLDEMLWNVESEFRGKSRNDKFLQIMKDYETPLFSGCKKEHNKLHIVLTLLQMKASNGWSDKGFNELYIFWKICFQMPTCCVKARTKLRKLFVH
jgi:hypothetical protein